MRASFLAAAILAVTPGLSLACTCAGTQSIGRALALAEAVVVGRVKGRSPPDYSSEHPRPATIVVEVTESLKGSLKGDIEVAERLMCYQSFSSEDFKVGTFYVFPLTEIDIANADDAFGVLHEPPGTSVPSYKVFVLPVCSHTALLLEDASLYTNELTSSGGRQLEYYMGLRLLRVLFATGLVDYLRAIAAVGAAMVLCVTLVLVRRRRAKTHRD